MKQREEIISKIKDCCIHSNDSGDIYDNEAIVDYIISEIQESHQKGISEGISIGMKNVKEEIAKAHSEGRKEAEKDIFPICFFDKWIDHEPAWNIVLSKDKQLTGITSSEIRRACRGTSFEHAQVVTNGMLKIYCDSISN